MFSHLNHLLENNGLDLWVRSKKLSLMREIDVYSVILIWYVTPYFRDWWSCTVTEKSCWNHRSYVWIELLSGMVIVPVQKLSGKVWIQPKSAESFYELTLHVQRLTVTHFIAIIQLIQFMQTGYCLWDSSWTGIIFRSFYVSVNLPTYPSPKPTLTHSSYLGQNFGLGEG